MDLCGKNVRVDLCEKKCLKKCFKMNLYVIGPKRKEKEGQSGLQ